jgi:glycosyltransferase involved in cell wall biosynthesis
VRLNLPYQLVALARDSSSAALLAERTPVIYVGGGPALVTEQLAIPLAVRKRRVDLVVTTSERLPLWRAARYVVWLFEVPTHRIEQNRLRRTPPYQRASDVLTLALWKRSLRAAAGVAAASEATAREIAATVPEVRADIRVVHAAVNEAFRPGHSEPRGRYVFMLGSADPRDNLDMAVGAFARARARTGAKVRLLIAGDLGSVRDTVETEVVRCDLGGAVEFVGRVSDEELAKLYRGAAVYLDTTAFEGFGYQPLEAMACGAPVVVSGVASLVEIVGNAGLLCDPNSQGQFADALTRILTDDTLAARLRRCARARAKTFTWERSARQMAALIADALVARRWKLRS